MRPFDKFCDFIVWFVAMTMVALAIVLESAVAIGILWVVYKLGMKVIGG